MQAGGVGLATAMYQRGHLILWAFQRVAAADPPSYFFARPDTFYLFLFWRLCISLE